MKTIIDKKTGEFVHYIGSGEFGTCSIPTIYPDTMNLDLLKNYYENKNDKVFRFDDYEVKNIEVKILD